jgi:hypothetical protein
MNIRADIYQGDAGIILKNNVDEIKMRIRPSSIKFAAIYVLLPLYAFTISMV